MILTAFQSDVLLHTSSNGRYVTDEAAVLEMAKLGLLYDHGPQRLAGGMHYLVMTRAGRSALNEWHAAQPKPKVKKRRMSEQFQSWRNFCDGYDRISFSEFLKTVWPNRHSFR